MGIKSFAAKIIAKVVAYNNKKWINNPIEIQKKTLNYLMKKAADTQFGKEHNFSSISTHKDFVSNVPIRDYEAHRIYIEKIQQGEKDVLWPGLPDFFAKTSGTTSGAKYIPLTKDSLPFHINSARNALLNYVIEKPETIFFDGKMIFLQGSPTLEKENGINLGRLSGIVAHYVPSYLQKNRLPSWETNCIEDWEEKVDKIVEETLNQDLTLISGIPPWVQMYFEKLTERTGKKVGEIFPNFNLFVTGGVSYSPYKKRMDELIGREVDVVQTYPASEGFIAYQDKLEEPDLLLLLDNGIFYEFVPTNEMNNEKPLRLGLEEVEMGVDYAILLSTNAGLWAYNIGDTIQFTSLKPFRIIVSGRLKHFTSAFGEHVIANEVEYALNETLKTHPCSVVEFTVAPKVNPDSGLPYHEWFVEFEKAPADLAGFSSKLDLMLQEKNSYYYDLIKGKILKPLVVVPLSKGAFQKYMDSIGKLGGQNKVPRLSNDRKIAEKLDLYSR